jgi:hypothetical protein
VGLLLAALTAATTADAAVPPQPPCSADAAVAPVSADHNPLIGLWHPDEVPADWRLADCAGLALPTGAVLVTVTGRLHHDGDARALLARLGRASEQLKILYWSVEDGAWRPLLTDAAALSGPDPTLRRPDFKPDEMRVGERLHMLFDDDRPPGPVVFETEIREADADGFMTVTVNVSPLTLMGMTIAGPGDLASLLAVDRVGADEFSYYALSAIALSSMAAASVSDAAHINRAVAAFRYIAGIPGDRDPPAAADGPTPSASWRTAPED